MWEFTSPVAMVGALSNNVVHFLTFSYPLLPVATMTHSIDCPALALTEATIKKALLEAHWEIDSSIIVVVFSHLPCYLWDYLGGSRLT